MQGAVSRLLMGLLWSLWTLAVSVSLLRGARRAPVVPAPAERVPEPAR